MDILGVNEKNKILEYYNVIKNNKTHSNYYMLTILRNEMTNDGINIFKNHLLNKCNVKNIKIKFLLFQNNLFLLFILELNDNNNFHLYELKNTFDIINIISQDHYDILLDENNINSTLLKTSYLYAIHKLIYS